MLTGKELGSTWGLLSVAASGALGLLKSGVKAYRAGAEAKFVDLKDLSAPDGVLHAVYGDFLESALAEGTYLAAPEPLVVGHGLRRIQEAIDWQMEGLSARKVVVTL